MANNFILRIKLWRTPKERKSPLPVTLLSAQLEHRHGGFIVLRLTMNGTAAAEFLGTYKDAHCEIRTKENWLIEIPKMSVEQLSLDAPATGNPYVTALLRGRDMTTSLGV